MAKSKGKLSLAPKRVVLYAPADAGSRRRIVEGVIRYARSGPGWDLFYEPERADFSLLREPVQHCDGVIAMTPRSDSKALFKSIRKPMVVVADRIDPYPMVAPDEEAVGALACAYFRDRGIHQLAFCGLPPGEFSERRLAGFQSAASAASIRVQAYPRVIYSSMEYHDHEARPLMQWLRQLPKPCGLLAATSTVAWAVMRLIRRAGLSVPDDIAVLGVDDDEVINDLCVPTLSFIDQNCDGLGQAAAKLLDQWMNGQPPAQRIVTVRPNGVLSAKSTDVLHSDDPDVGVALRYIRASVGKMISVDDVVARVSTGRRALERAFEKRVGRGIYEEIVRTRLELAAQLLSQTSTPIAQIARRCGFKSPSKFSSSFRDALGQTPSGYRDSITPARPIV
jgi:LacI family transcriptional regulator